MALTTRVWSAGKLLLLGGALLLTYVLFAAAAMRVALKTRETVVPTLGGKTVNEATATLADAGLTLKVEEGRRVDPKVPAGQILAQEPQAGVRTRRQRSVKVWVSSGPRAMIVPALVGESERTAQLRVQEDGLELADTAEVRSADYAAGAIIAQTPPPKSNAPRVALLVNRGETRRYLRDAGSHRRQRRSSRRPAAPARLPRGDGRRPSVPGRSGRGRHPPEPAGRVSDRAGRAHLAGGQPLNRPLLIAPSILAADFAALGEAIAAAERGGADLIHVDVMDGHFVPNLSMGPPVVRSLKKVATVPLDVHLMIEEPDRFVEDFVQAGAAMISVHVEVLPHLHRTIQLIKSLGARAGVAINPSTPVVALDEIAPDLDHVLVMSVNPGFGGQTFIPRSESKIRAIRALLDRHGNERPDRGGRRRRSAQRGADRPGRGQYPRRRAFDLRHGGPGPGDAGPARGSLRGSGPSGMTGADRPASRVRVRYAETDKMGVVYYANYFVWFEVARADVLRVARVELPGDGGGRRLAAGDRGALPVSPAREIRRRAGSEGQRGACCRQYGWNSRIRWSGRRTRSWWPRAEPCMPR